MSKEIKKSILRVLINSDWKSTLQIIKETKYPIPQTIRNYLWKMKRWGELYQEKRGNQSFWKITPVWKKRRMVWLRKENITRR